MNCLASEGFFDKGARFSGDSVVLCFRSLWCFPDVRDKESERSLATDLLLGTSHAEATPAEWSRRVDLFPIHRGERRGNRRRRRRNRGRPSFPAGRAERKSKERSTVPFAGSVDSVPSPRSSSACTPGPGRAEARRRGPSKLLRAPPLPNLDEDGHRLASRGGHPLRTRSARPPPRSTQTALPPPTRALPSEGRRRLRRATSFAVRRTPSAPVPRLPGRR